jgi:hypothetical protein
MDTLHALRATGLHLAVDDFGTGYSSFSYLKHLPLDALKIDRSFVREITTSPDDAAITTAIIAMAHALNLKVVGEGIETEAQREVLLQQRCDEMRGYLFSRPVVAEQLAVPGQDAGAAVAEVVDGVMAVSCCGRRRDVRRITDLTLSPTPPYPLPSDHHAGHPAGRTDSKHASVSSGPGAPSVGLTRINRSASSAPATNAATLSLVASHVCGRTSAARIQR